MQILGIDFTSRPNRQKPLTCAICQFKNRTLRVETLENWHQFDEFETALMKPGPWIAGIDFPFGQSRKFIANIRWPGTWCEYVLHADSLGSAGFCDALNTYRSRRPYGCKEHRRKTDEVAKSISPQKLYGIPVGRMFFQGSPRLVRAGVTIPGLQVGDPKRIVVEAYPTLLARKFGEKKSYKNDSKPKQTKAQHEVRRAILNRITNGACFADYSLNVEATTSLVDSFVNDATGDQLDALLCAIQAAWSWSQRESGYGAPNNLDTLEGWIADPSLKY